MSGAEQRICELEGSVQEAIVALRQHGESLWGLRLESSLLLIKRRDSRGLESLLAMYGVMGRRASSRDGVSSGIPPMSL
jgi:hypothetical protein